MNFFRCQPQFEFPLTLGRDFSGHIAAKGQNVSNQYQIGDAVYGVVPVQEQGSHAEFVLVNESNVCVYLSTFSHCLMMRLNESACKNFRNSPNQLLLKKQKKNK